MATGRTAGLVKLVKDELSKRKILMNKDMEESLTADLYQGLYDFFVEIDKKYSPQLANLKHLSELPNKEEKYKENLKNEIKQIGQAIEETEKDVAWKIIHKWEILNIKG